MKAENIKRIRLLRIWEILHSETDEENPMGTTTIIKKLADGGIECDRRTLYKDIDILNDFGYEILKTRSSCNEYYVVDRSFDIPEVRILMDAVQAAGFVTQKKTLELVDKIAVLAGSGRTEVLKQNIVEFATPKSDNENIYYVVNEISTAINQKKKIEFEYFDYDENHDRIFRKDKKDPTVNRRYKVNPVATIFSNDKYYLVCYDDKHGNLSQYRVDRIDSVKVLNRKISVTEKSEKFDIARHKRQMFGMFVGNVERVSFIVDSKLIDVIFDVFGDDVRLIRKDDKIYFNAEVQVSPTFFAWCCSFGQSLQLHAPRRVVNELKDYINSLSENYQTK